MCHHIWTQWFLQPLKIIFMRGVTFVVIQDQINKRAHILDQHSPVVLKCWTISEQRPCTLIFAPDPRSSIISSVTNSSNPLHFLYPPSGYSYFSTTYQLLIFHNYFIFVSLYQNFMEIRYYKYYSLLSPLPICLARYRFLVRIFEWKNKLMIEWTQELRESRM